MLGYAFGAMSILTKNNWFLFMVGSSCDKKGLSQYTWGVGPCDYEPGILDSRHGKMIVAPGEYVSFYFKDASDKSKITAKMLRDCVSSYFFS